MAKVLIVEDDVSLQEMYRKQMTGFELVQAYSLDEGRQLFQQHSDSLDAIVLDGNLGQGERGHVLAREIREAGYTGPVIAASNSTTSTDELLKAGCNHHVDIKIYVAELMEKLLP